MAINWSSSKSKLDVSTIKPSETSQIDRLGCVIDISIILL